MNKKLLYSSLAIVILFTSLFIVKKIKRSYAPQINLSSINIKSLDGNLIPKASLIGKPLVLNFWGTWCGPCRQELPNFEKANLTYGSKVNFIIISDEPVEKLIQFKAGHNYSFLYAQSQKPFHELGITSVPFTYFYNAAGELIYKNKDVLSEMELNHLIEKLIGK